MLFYFTSFTWYFFMAPIRGGNKKRKTDEKDEHNTVLSGSSMESSVDWFMMVSKKIAEQRSEMTYFMFSLGNEY
ncbi:hypothetical protein Leryth_021997 [Lithospermum erythrorhizon]|nr:hypothetical protein Leryth_021997 [Lithospermum erythrorhizon]